MSSISDMFWKLCGGLQGSRKIIFAPTKAVHCSEALADAESFCVCQCVLNNSCSEADVLQIIPKPHSAAVQAVPIEVSSSDSSVPPITPQAGKTEEMVPQHLSSQSPHNRQAIFCAAALVVLQVQ